MRNWVADNIIPAYFALAIIAGITLVVVAADLDPTGRLKKWLRL